MITNTKFSLLNTVEVMQHKLGVGEIQPKNIINYLGQTKSHQTLYTGLQELVNDGYLKKRSEGKFTYYSLTDKGRDFLLENKELKHRNLTDPLIKNIANKLIESHPDDFKDISYSVLTDYLNKQLKDLEELTFNAARNHFVSNSKKDNIRRVTEG